MSHSRRSLSPVQLRYFKMGPKVLDPEDLDTRRRIDQAIDCRIAVGNSYREQPSLITLNRLAKTTYGNFEGTIRNFSLLLNKAFGQDTVQHQIQKFGPRARALTTHMILSRKKADRAGSKEQTLRQKIKKISDDRRFIQAQSFKNGKKLKLKLKSFQLQGVHSPASQMLQLTYLNVLVSHVNTSRLVSTLEPALKIQGNTITVGFQKILSRLSDYNNRETKYQQKHLLFECFGQELRLVCPVLEIRTSEDTWMETMLENEDILAILEGNFDNVDEMADKYFDEGSLVSL